MTDDTRLAEIEAWANVTRSGPYYPADIFRLTAEDMDWLKQRPVTNADVRWLLSRVRALTRETQLAEDGRMDMAKANGVLAGRVRALSAQVTTKDAQLDLVTEMLETAFEIYPDLHNAPAMVAAFEGRTARDAGKGE
jgi:hypothetical protein